MCDATLWNELDETTLVNMEKINKPYTKRRAEGRDGGTQHAGNNTDNSGWLKNGGTRHSDNCNVMGLTYFNGARNSHKCERKKRALPNSEEKRTRVKS